MVIKLQVQQLHKIWITFLWPLTYHSLSPDSRQEASHYGRWSKMGCWNGHRNSTSIWCHMHQWFRWNSDHFVDSNRWANHVRQPSHNFCDASSCIVTNLMSMFSAVMIKTKIWMNDVVSIESHQYETSHFQNYTLPQQRFISLTAVISTQCVWKLCIP